MSNLIDRHAAIIALCQAGCGSGYCGVSCDDVKAIENLPSPIPVLDEWRKECKEYDNDKHRCPRFNQVIRSTVEDLREDSILLDSFISLDDYDITPESVEDEGGTVKWGIRIKRKGDV